MLTNADLTVYHLTIDEETREEGWVKTVIRGVCWQETAAIQAENGVSVSGVRGSDCVKVFLPRSSWPGSAPPCAVEDRIAKGIRQELSPPVDALSVMSVSNKDLGRTVQHWAITAV